MSGRKTVGLPLQGYLQLLRHHGENRVMALRAALWARQEVGHFGSVQTFCLFLGHARSGHSLVGALIDAHPLAMISHELNALRFVEAGFSRGQLYAMIVRNSRAHARAGRKWTGYSYAVPGQWQGRAQELQVIGDKRGRTTTLALGRRPELIERVGAVVRDEVRYVHVVRNPFDNISTMARRNGRSLEYNISSYFEICEVIETVQGQVDGAAVLSIRHESLIQDPMGTIQQVCGHLGLPCPEDYAAACAGIVYEAPHQSREKVAWPAEARARVADGIDRHDYLSGYSYEN